MAYRKRIIDNYGWECNYSNSLKYKGHPTGEFTKIARVSTPSGPGIAVHYKSKTLLDRVSRLYKKQDDVPHIAKIITIIEEVVIFEEAHGDLIWHLDFVDFNQIQKVLTETVDALQKLDIIHGDIRPWNIFSSNCGSKDFQIVDWGFSCLISNYNDNPKRNHFNRRGHLSTEPSDIDRQDIQRLVQVLQGHISPEAAWNHPTNPPTFTWRPPWCSNP